MSYYLWYQIKFTSSSLPRRRYTRHTRVWAKYGAGPISLRLRKQTLFISPARQIRTRDFLHV